jgi:hypothetical protein
MEMLLSDCGIDYISGGSKHCTAGWVQMDCPFCGSGKQHLGYNLSKNYFNCWKCGWHPTDETLSVLLGKNRSEIRLLMKQYRTLHPAQEQEETEAETETDLKFVNLPYGTGELKMIHINYLVSRGFDNWKEVRDTWDLKGTGHLGKYSFRIILPIYFNGRLVSYQGRDVTGVADLRYKACPREEEAISHQDILYGMDLIPGDTVVVTEGAFDAIRIGPGAVATFGIGFSNQQVKHLSKYSSIFILFDSLEKEAREQGEKLAWSLAGGGRSVEILTIDRKDPGSMTAEEAAALRKEIGL